MDSVQELVLPVKGTFESSDLSNGSILFIGTATVLLRYAGFPILTDPNFLHEGDHIHLGYGLQATRTTNPALEIEQLPPLDFVVLSHFHADHFERVVIEKLDKNLPIITTDEAVGNLKDKRFQNLQASSPVLRVITHAYNLLMSSFSAFMMVKICIIKYFLHSGFGRARTDYDFTKGCQSL